MKKHCPARKAAALLLAAFVTAGALPSAGAADTERKYQEKEITAYLYEAEKTVPLNCLFYEDMPFEPYINAGDFFARLFEADFTVRDDGNGVFTVTAPNGMTMVTNTETDTVHFDFYEKFMTADPADADGDGREGSYIKNPETVVVGDAKGIDLPYGNYQIDITAANGNLYFPLTTLADMCTATYLSAVYHDGSIYFFQPMEPAYFDRSSMYSAQPRTEAEAAFAYRELCFVLDHFYGKPRRSEFAQKMVQQDIDSLLSSDEAKGIKPLLLSQSMTDYYTGLVLLDSLLDDGGHTSLSSDYTTALLSDKPSELATAVSALLDDPTNANAASIAANIKMIQDKKEHLSDLFKLRKEHYAAYENVKLWEDEEAEGDDRFVAQLFLCGDTAVFVFDDFKDAVVEPFKWSLDYAAEKGVKNFLIDVSQNLGGTTSVLQYMMAIMTGNGDYYTTSTLSGNRLRNTGSIDKNLDGTIDEKDDAVSYDFRFALLTTNSSYSCGNFLPCLAQKQGIPVVGQVSGGGTCALINPVFPNKMTYTLSGYSTFTDDENNDVEAGAKPDLETVTVDAEGNADYSKLYDINAVSEFLSKQPVPTKPSQSTASSAKASDGSGMPFGFVVLIAVAATAILAAVIIILIKMRKKARS